MKAKDKLKSKKWRMSHLYKIINKAAKKIVYKRNKAQEHFNKHKWYRNLILKTRELAVKKYTEVLGATTNKLKRKSADIAPELVERGTIIKSLDDIYKQADAIGDDVVNEIDNVWRSLPDDELYDVKPMVEKLEKLREKYIINGNIVKPDNVKAIDETVDIIKAISIKGNKFDDSFVKYLTNRYGADKIDIKNLRKLRQIFDEGKDFTSALGEKKFIDKVEETAANEIRNIINSEVPDLGMLNREFHFWNTVKEITGKTLERKSSQTGGSVLTGLISGASGFASGDTMGERIERGVIYGFLGKKGMDFLRSPAYKTVSSQAKIKLADAIASGDIQKVNLILSKMVAGAHNELDE